MLFFPPWRPHSVRIWSAGRRCSGAWWGPSECPRWCGRTPVVSPGTRVGGESRDWEGGREGGREGGWEDNKYIQVALLYIIDTNGTEESVIVSEVSSFQRLKCMQEWYFGWENVSCLEKCPYRVFHCTYIQWCGTINGQKPYHKTIYQSLIQLNTANSSRQQWCTDSYGDQRCLTLNRQTQRQRMQSVASMTAKMAPPTHTPATRMIGRPVADSSSAREEK